MMQSEHAPTQSAVSTRGARGESATSFADRQLSTQAILDWYLAPMLGLSGVILLLRCSSVRDVLFALGGLLLVASHVLSVRTRERLLEQLRDHARRHGLDEAAASERARRELEALAAAVNGSRTAAELSYRRLPPPYLA